MFCKNEVLKISSNFTGKHLRQSLFFNTVTGLRPATLLKKRLWHMPFPVNFEKFLRTTVFMEHLRWLLLYYLLSISRQRAVDDTHSSKFKYMFQLIAKDKKLLSAKLFNEKLKKKFIYNLTCE